VVLMYVRFPLSLRNVEDLLFERGIDICHETVRLWWNRFGPLFAGKVWRQRVSRMRGFRHWRWHLDEMYVKLQPAFLSSLRSTFQAWIASYNAATFFFGVIEIPLAITHGAPMSVSAYVL